MEKNENTFTLRLPKTQMAFLKRMAGQEERTVSACIRMIIGNERKKTQNRLSGAVTGSQNLINRD